MDDSSNSKADGPALRYAVFSAVLCMFYFVALLAPLKLSPTRTLLGSIFIGACGVALAIRAINSTRPAARAIGVTAVVIFALGVPILFLILLQWLMRGHGISPFM